MVHFETFGFCLEIWRRRVCARVRDIEAWLPQGSEAINMLITSDRDCFYSTAVSADYGPSGRGL